MKKFLVLMLALLPIFQMFGCASTGGGISESSDLPEESQSESSSEEESGKIPDDVLNLKPVSDVYLIKDYNAPVFGDYADHGGNQTRAVTTSHGVYMAYLTINPDESSDLQHFSLVKIDLANGCEVLHTGTFTGTSNSAYIMADKDENVYVVCGTGRSEPHAVGTNIYKYDHKTGETTEYSQLYNCGVPSGGYGYACGFIDNNKNVIYTVHCGGDKRGAFTVIRFDIETLTFVDMTEFSIPGRHCYLFAQPTSDGGFAIIGQRDVSTGATGFKKYFTQGGYWANYVWDDLRVFLFGVDESNTVVLKNTLVLDLADYVQESGLYPQNHVNKFGDVLVDKEGNTHVLYLNSNDNGVAALIWYHVIYDASFNEIYREPIVFNKDYPLAQQMMYQTEDGVYYVVSIPKKFVDENTNLFGNLDGLGTSVSASGHGYIEVYRSEDGKNFSKIYVSEFDGNGWSPYTAVAGQPSRNGSINNGVMHVMVSNDDTWAYFTVDFNAIETMLEYGLLD